MKYKKNILLSWLIILSSDLSIWLGVNRIRQSGKDASFKFDAPGMEICE